MHRRKILLYRTGDAAHEIIRDVGNYIEWFRGVLGERVTLEAHWAAERPHPSTKDFDGVLITGSPLSLVEPERWMDEACEFVRRAADDGVPVLGVCFGHQLVGRAFGGRIRQHPRGWEAGTNEVHLTDEGRRDPLFAGVSDRIAVNQSHRDEVETLGPGVTRLASGTHSENQSIAAGDHVRGVQFHPEMSGAVIRRVIEHRRLILTDDARATGRETTHHAEALLGRVRETPEAQRVLVNFVDHFVAKA